MLTVAILNEYNLFERFIENSQVSLPSNYIFKENVVEVKIYLIRK
jgi:hypothetical protein